MTPAAVLDTIEVSTNSRVSQNVMDVDLKRVLERMRELFGLPTKLHDGSLLFVQASTVEERVFGTRITVHGPDKVSIEGITVAVVKIHHVRPMSSAFPEQ